MAEPHRWATSGGGGSRDSAAGATRSQGASGGRWSSRGLNWALLNDVCVLHIGLGLLNDFCVPHVFIL